MKRNKDNDEVSRIAGTVDGKTTTTAICYCYDVPQFTSTVNQQRLANNRTMAKNPTELSSFKKNCIFSKKCRTTNWVDFWNMRKKQNWCIYLCLSKFSTRRLGRQQITKHR